MSLAGDITLDHLKQKNSGDILLAPFLFTLISSPFTRIKTILLTKEKNPFIMKKNKSKLDGLGIGIIRMIKKKEGIKGFWRGSSIPLFYSIFFKMPLFLPYFNNRITNFLKVLNGKQGQYDQIGAGYTVSLIYHPLKLIQTNYCMYLYGKNDVKMFNGVVDCTKKIFKSEGFLGFYRGYSMNFLVLSSIFLYGKLRISKKEDQWKEEYQAKVDSSGVREIESFEEFKERREWFDTAGRWSIWLSLILFSSCQDMVITRKMVVDFDRDKTKVERGVFQEWKYIKNNYGYVNGILRGYPLAYVGKQFPGWIIAGFVLGLNPIVEEESK